MKKHALFVAFAVSLATVPAITGAARTSDDGEDGEGLHPGRPVEHGGQGQEHTARTPGHRPKDERSCSPICGRTASGSSATTYSSSSWNRNGGLTIGYGSPDRTGVELEFGTMMGDHFDEPVLLIKTAWGGHSLFKLFRSAIGRHAQ